MKTNERYREIKRQDWYRTLIVLLIYIVMITVLSLFLLPDYWLTWVTILFVSIYWLLEWHTKNFAYRCSNCNEIFEISLLENFLGPNNITKKYLKCPHCGKRGWAQVVVIKKQEITTSK